MKKADHKTSIPVAKAILAMKAALWDAYGADFSFSVAGNGKLLAASNISYGEINPNCETYLEYGQILYCPETKTRYVVGKYWKEDTDAMNYKVRLNIDSGEFNADHNCGSYYSSDLVTLIDQGYFQIVN